jgi:hypothetical protein
MSTIFESAVYNLRKQAPFARPCPMDLMTEKAFESDRGIVIFSVQHRPSVASRLWWSIRWRENGSAIQASAQDWELCLWRAIQKHKECERRRKIEEGPVTAGPTRGGLAESKGWEAGDGI